MLARLSRNPGTNAYPRMFRGPPTNEKRNFLLKSNLGKNRLRALVRLVAQEIVTPGHLTGKRIPTGVGLRRCRARGWLRLRWRGRSWLRLWGWGWLRLRWWGRGWLGLRAGARFGCWRSRTRSRPGTRRARAGGTIRGAPASALTRAHSSIGSLPNSTRDD